MAMFLNMCVSTYLILKNTIIAVIPKCESSNVFQV
jgi:hypothetical protein